MYKKFYNLKENPFNVTADPSFFFSSTRHTEAFAHLVYGIQQRKGITVVTGEIGTGKTTLCRTLLNHVDKEKTKTAFILNPYFSELQLLQLIVRDFGLSLQDRPKNKLSLVNTLNEFLLQEATDGNNVALIIDEAQNLKPRQLEQIRLLSNLETEKQKLLQIILVGQPELLEKLQLPNLRQLNQRIAVRFHILPLERNEVAEYIHHRLRVATLNLDGQHGIFFAPEAIDMIFRYSKGTPRLINVICDRALLAGFVAETPSVSEAMIHKCAREAGKVFH